MNRTAAEEAMVSKEQASVNHLLSRWLCSSRAWADRLPHLKLLRVCSFVRPGHAICQEDPEENQHSEVSIEAKCV